MTNEEIIKNYYVTSINFCEGGDPECDCNGYGHFIVNNDYCFDDDDDRNIIYDLQDKIFYNEIDGVTEEQLLEALKEEIKEYFKH